MAPENVLDKIQKLLDLEQGARNIGSLEEAANAAEKVQRLLTKYNLEMSDVSMHIRKDSMDINKFAFEDVTNAKNEGQWIHSLYSMLANHNYCKLVRTISHKWDPTKGNVRVTYANLVGTKTNVEVVRKLALRLEERIRTFEREAWRKDQHMHKNRNAYRRAYFMGAVQGLNHQLEYIKQQEMQENVNVRSLVVQNERQLQEAMANLFSNLTDARRKRALSNGAAGARGFDDGLNMPTGESIGS